MRGSFSSSVPRSPCHLADLGEIGDEIRMFLSGFWDLRGLMRLEMILDVRERDLLCFGAVSTSMLVGRRFSIFLGEGTRNGCDEGTGPADCS